MELSAHVRKSTSNLFRGTYTWFAHQLDNQKPKGTIAALDGVRAIACIMVVVFHSTGIVLTQEDLLHSPFLAAFNLFLAKGVTLFFLLSGFLLFYPYAQALLFEKRWPQARIFYLRRVLRIVPGYFFSLFFLILLTKPGYLEIHNLGTLVFLLTFLMTHQQASGINPVYWSLAVEFQYYILLPWIALGIYGLTKLVRPQQRLWVVIGSLLLMIVWGLATRWWGYTLFARPDATTVLTSHPITKIITVLVYGNSSLDSGKYLDDFAIGMLLAVCYVVLANTSRGHIYQRMLLRLSPWLWWIGIALLVFAEGRNVNAFFQLYPLWAVELAIALGFGCCMLAILYNGSGVLKRFFEWTPLRWIGLISFSLFLWHFPVIDALKVSLAPDLFKHFSFPLALGIYAVVEAVMVLALSFILYMLVEKPAMDLSGRLRNKLTHHEQKEFTRPLNPPLQDAEFDAEKTEPRQAIVLGKDFHH